MIAEGTVVTTLTLPLVVLPHFAEGLREVLAKFNTGRIVAAPATVQAWRDSLAIIEQRMHEQKDFLEL